MKANPEGIVFANGQVSVRDRANSAMPFREAVSKAVVEEISCRAQRNEDYNGYAMNTPQFAIGKRGIGGVQFAEISVGTETGRVKAERIVAVHDVGATSLPSMLTALQPGPCRQPPVGIGTVDCGIASRVVCKTTANRTPDHDAMELGQISLLIDPRARPMGRKIRFRHLGPKCTRRSRLTERSLAAQAWSA